MVSGGVMLKRFTGQEPLLCDICHAAATDAIKRCRLQIKWNGTQASLKKYGCSELNQDLQLSSVGVHQHLQEFQVLPTGGNKTTN